MSARPGTHAVHVLGHCRGQFGYSPDDFPVARDCDRYSMAIPLHNRMVVEGFRYVVDAIKSLG